ncbi:MAG TPA: phosphonate ABC transporter substrate-binding protein, partial [Alphaproteobacteria bacterium]|nr:phosphonate ABC transporter substrate-binding protein [Alphaproteobacteria bacterium]
MMTRFLTALTALLAVATTAQAQEGETIVFGVVATEQSENVLHLWEPFVEDMSRDTGYNVELRSATDYAGVIEAMRADQVQVAWLTNASGLEASRRANAEVFAKFIYPDGQLGYRSIIIVPNDSPMQNVEDLVVCDGTVNFGLGDPLSTSGTLVPQAYIFADRGIDPQTCFNQVTSASHEQNLMAVANGQLDAATNNTTNIDRLQRARPDVLERVRIIWRSPLIQTDPIMWRTDLSAEAKARIQEFFLTYGWRGDAAQREHEQAVLRELEMGGFLPATNEHFQPIMRLELIRDLAETRSDTRLTEDERAERVAELEAELAELSELERLVAARDLSADIAMARQQMIANPDGPQDQVSTLVSTYLQDSPRPEGRAAQINRRPEASQLSRMLIGLVVGLIVGFAIFLTSKPPKYAPGRMASDRIIDAAIWGGFVGLLVWSFWPAEVFKLPLLAENSDRMGEYV